MLQAWLLRIQRSQYVPMIVERRMLQMRVLHLAAGLSRGICLVVSMPVPRIQPSVGITSVSLIDTRAIVLVAMPIAVVAHVFEFELSSYFILARSQRPIGSS